MKPPSPSASPAAEPQGAPSRVAEAQGAPPRAAGPQGQSPRAAGRRARTLVFALGSAAALVIAAFALAAPSPLGRDLAVARGTGWAALGALFASLAVSPLLALLPRPRRGSLAALRRELGLTSAGFALVHLAATLLTRLAPDPALLLLEPQERAGLGALVILAALALTSFPALLRVRAWKELHRLTYLAAPIAVLHVALSSMAPVHLLGAAVLVLLALFLARLVRTLWGRGGAAR